MQRATSLEKIKILGQIIPGNFGGKVAYAYTKTFYLINLTLCLQKLTSGLKLAKRYINLGYIFNPVTHSGIYLRTFGVRPIPVTSDSISHEEQSLH